MQINKWLGVMVLCVLFTKAGVSQQMRLGINPWTVEKSAVLELQSTNQGLLFSRIADTTLINALNPPDGMVVFFNPTKQLLLRSNGAWQMLVTPGRLSAGTGISYNAATGVISNTGVTSVNGNTGALTMDTGYISNFYQKVRGLFSASAPITLTNGQIGISQATTSTNGYLSSTDWNTFNNKLSSVDTTNIANFYQKVRGLFSAGSGITYNSTTGVITNSGGAGSGWALNGNTVAAEKKIGTIDLYDLPFITHNTEQMRLDTGGNLAIGTSTYDAIAREKVLIDAGTTDSYNLLIAKGSRNGYLQFNITNEATGGQASTDIVATANNGTETTNYVDLGINGGGYNNANNILSGANNGYLYSAGEDFIIGNSSSTKNLIVFTGGIATSNERMRITSAGRVGIGTTTPSTTLDVSGTYKLGSSGTALNNMIKTSFSINDNTNITVSTTRQVTATVTGAVANASVILNPRSALPSGITIAYSYISSANTITIGFINTQLSSQAVGSVTFDVTLIQ